MHFGGVVSTSAWPKQFWAYGVPLGLTAILSQTSSYTDRFVISWFSGGEQLAIYAVAWALVVLAIGLIGGAISGAMLPLINPGA